MTEAQLIHEGWTFWEAPAFYMGTQWSYEDKQAMRQSGVKPLPINTMRAFRLDPSEEIVGVTGG